MLYSNVSYTCQVTILCNYFHLTPFQLHRKAQRGAEYFRILTPFADKLGEDFENLLPQWEEAAEKLCNQLVIYSWPKRYCEVIGLASQTRGIECLVSSMVRLAISMGVTSGNGGEQLRRALLSLCEEEEEAGDPDQHVLCKLRHQQEESEGVQ